VVTVGLVLKMDVRRAIAGFRLALAVHAGITAARFLVGGRPLRARNALRPPCRKREVGLRTREIPCGVWRRREGGRCVALRLREVVRVLSEVERCSRRLLTCKLSRSRRRWLLHPVLVDECTTCLTRKGVVAVIDDAGGSSEWVVLVSNTSCANPMPSQLSAFCAFYTYLE